MKKKWKRLTSILLVLVMVVGMFSYSAAAGEVEETPEVTSVEKTADAQGQGVETEVSVETQEQSATEEETASDPTVEPENTEVDSETPDSVAKDDPVAEVEEESEAQLDEKVEAADTEVPNVGAGVGIKAYYEGQDFDDPGTKIIRTVDNPLNDAAIVNVQAEFTLDETNKQIVIELKDGLMIYNAPGFTGTSENLGTFSKNNLPDELKDVITGAAFTRNPNVSGITSYAGTLVYSVSSSATGVDMKVLLGGDGRLFNSVVGTDSVDYVNAVTISKQVDSVVVDSTTLPLYQFNGNVRFAQRYITDTGVDTMTTTPYYVAEGDSFSTVVFFRTEVPVTGSSKLLQSYSLPDIKSVTGTYKVPKGSGISGVSLEGLEYSATIKDYKHTSLTDSDIEFSITDAGDGIHDICTVLLKEGFNNVNPTFKLVGTVPVGAALGVRNIIEINNVTYNAVRNDGTLVKMLLVTYLQYHVVPAYNNKLTLAKLSGAETIPADQFNSPADMIGLGGFRIINQQTQAVTDKVIKLTYDTGNTRSINVQAVQLFCGAAGVSDVHATTVSGNPVTVKSISSIANDCVTVLFAGLTEGDSIKTVTYRTTDIAKGKETHEYDMRSNAIPGAKYLGRLTRELAIGENYTSRIEVYSDEDHSYDYEPGADNSSKLDNYYDQKITVVGGPHKIRYNSTNTTMSGSLIGGGVAKKISVTADMVNYRYDLNQHSAYKGMTFYVFQPDNVFTVNRDTIQVQWNGKTYTEGAGLSVSDPVSVDGGIVYTVKAADVVIGDYTSSIGKYPSVTLNFEVQATPTAKAQTVFYKDIIMFDATENVGFAGAESTSLQHASQRYDTKNIAGRGSDYLIGCANLYSTFAVIPQQDLAVTMAAAGSDGEYKSYTSGNDASIINLQQNTDATIKLEMTNNAQAVLPDGFEIMLPIPKTGETMPAIGQYSAKTFTWTAGIEEEVVIPGYTVKYATAYGIDKDSLMWKDWSGVSGSPEDIKMIKIISAKNLAVDYTDTITVPIKVSDPDAIAHAGKINIFSAAVWRKFGATEGVAASQEIALRLQTGSVKGHAFIDKDGNGTYNTTDTGIGGVIVNAYKTGGVHDSSTLLAGPVTTQVGTGAYEFVSLDPSQKVDIVFTNPKNPTGTIAADSLHFNAVAVDGDHSKYILKNVTPSAAGYDVQDAIMVLPKTIAFNTNSASPAVSAVYQFEGGKITDPGVTLTRQGYTMDIWYTSTAYSTKWDFANHTVAGDMTLYAKATQNNYTITYNCGFHGELAGQDVNGDVKFTNQHYGDNTPTAPAVTAEDGYTFRGWWPAVADKVTGDATYVAQYTQDDYTVTYSKGAHGTLAGQDGSGNVSTTDLHYGDNTPTEPTVTEEAGWTFTGWSPSRTAKVTGTVNYVAQYSQNKYTVTYNKGAHGTLADQDGSGNVSTANLVYNDNTPTAPAVTEEAGWTFTGWNPICASKVTATVTYVAQYSQNKYTVTYSKGTHGTLAGQDGSGNVTTANLVYNDNTPTAPAVTEEAGWTFTGWSPTRADKVTKNVTYVAQYTQNEYTVTYSKGTHGTLAGQDGSGNVAVTGLHYGDNTPTAPVVTEEAGWTFTGWTPTRADKVTETVTYVAEYSQDKYTVTYSKGDHGTLAGQDSSGNVSTDNLLYNDNTPTAPKVTAETGWTFTGWSPKHTDKVTETVTYVAQYSQNKYSVKFDLNGAAGTAPTTQSLHFADKVTSPSAPTRTGYAFAGWYKEAAGQTKWDFAKDTMPNQDLTLYAKWEPNQYKVTFNKNSGDTEATPATKTVTYPADVIDALPKPPTKAEYTFLSWNTKADGTGAEFTAATKVTADITVYAKWKKTSEVLDEDYSTPQPEDNYNFIKKPNTKSVKAGEVVNYTFSGFGNNYSFSLDEFCITDKPDKGLDIVSGRMPAFNNGSGVSYSVTYYTNLKGRRVLEDNIPADKAYSFKAPALKSGEYITGISFNFGTVPKGFAQGDTMELSFKVWDNPPAKDLVNEGGLSYKVKGVLKRYSYGGDYTSITLGGQFGSSGNVNATQRYGTGSVKTGDQSQVAMFAVIAVLSLGLAGIAVVKRRKKSGSH